MPVDMILAVRDKNIRPGASWEQRATAVGIILAFSCLLRPSEYLSKTKSDKHVLLAKSVQFEVTLPYREPQFYSAHELAAAGIQWCHVSLVRIEFKSSKTFNERAGRAIWFSVRLSTYR
jgi:hypothetical protein